MALHIEDPKLVAEILAESERRKVSPEEVVRRALNSQEAKAKARYEEIMGFLAASKIKPHEHPMTKEEEEEILGYGPDGF